MTIIGLQRRMVELGRIRLGDKGSKGQPQKLEAFRLTSPNRALLEQAAGLWGGTVREWSGSPTEGGFELYTEAAFLPIALPPSAEPCSQHMEQWNAGGCTHRCDGQTNSITDEPCSCDPDEPVCRVTTRINVMLPDLDALGVFRLETHGWNAAMELPGSLDVLVLARSKGVVIEGTLRIDHRVRKSGGQTRRFIVPVLDLRVPMRELLSGSKPAVEPGGGNGVAPPLLPVEAGGSEPPASGEAEVDGAISEAQRRRLFAIAKKAGVSTERVKEIILAVTGQESTKGITVLDYEAVCVDVERSGIAESSSPMMFPPAPRGVDPDAA